MTHRAASRVPCSVDERHLHANVSQTSTYLNATRIGLQESMRRFDPERATTAETKPHAADPDQTTRGREAVVN